MYDMHYDLLTILYYNLKENNKLANKEKLIADCKKIYANNNILGGFIDLYFMSKEEMHDELGIEDSELEDVYAMLKKSIEHLELFKTNGIIPSNIDFLYSIEGCDYLKSVDDLDGLYDLGVRAILPVWNERNKYGSGNRSNEGLTSLGKNLILKAIDLGIIIDVSHANINTFNDILDIVYEEKLKGKDVHLMASHSNVRNLCDRDRNLSDQQLKRLNELGGYIGLFLNGNFLSLDNEEITYEERENNFIKHLDYLINVIGFDKNRICIASDDMNFNADPAYHNLESFKLEEVSTVLRNKLVSIYGEDLTRKIMIDNARRLIRKVKGRNKSITL